MAEGGKEGKETRRRAGAGRARGSTGVCAGRHGAGAGSFGVAPPLLPSRPRDSTRHASQTPAKVRFSTAHVPSSAAIYLNFWESGNLNCRDLPEFLTFEVFVVVAAAREGGAGRGMDNSANMTRAAPGGTINWKRLLAVAAVVAGAAAVCSPECAVETLQRMCRAWLGRSVWGQRCQQTAVRAVSFLLTSPPSRFTNIHNNCNGLLNYSWG